MWTDPGNMYIAPKHMNKEIETKAAQFPEKEYITGIFLAVLDTKIAGVGNCKIKNKTSILPVYQTIAV